MIPVPGASVGTPYGRRGPYWSCDADAAGNGIHTGVDYPAAAGTPVVAARPGVACHCDHGSAFGSHQVEVRAGDGTRDFYAHMASRVADGTRVEAGDRVGQVGAEGNVTGPHLHFERHATEAGGWSCGVVRDPAPSLNYASEEEDMNLTDDIAEWSPDDGSTGETTVGKTLNQARGYAEDTYQRVKRLEETVDKIWDALKDL